MGELIRIALLLATVNNTSLPVAVYCADASAAARATPALSTAVARVSAPVALVSAPVAGAPRPPAARRADAWFGSDKVPHFWMSYATTAFTFAAVSAAGGDTDTALLAGVGAGAAAGVGKEVHDWRRGWTFSIKDLTVDALGVAAAYFFLREVR